MTVKPHRRTVDLKEKHIEKSKRKSVKTCGEIIFLAIERLKKRHFLCHSFISSDKYAKQIEFLSGLVSRCGNRMLLTLRTVTMSDGRGKPLSLCSELRGGRDWHLNWRRRPTTSSTTTDCRFTFFSRKSPRLLLAGLPLPST